MSARKSHDIWVSDHCRVGLTAAELYDLIRSNSSVALWNWRHQKKRIEFGNLANGIVGVPTSSEAISSRR